VASPFVGAYVGTKHAVEGISASLRRELLMYGIDVIILGPGVVKTPIWDKGVGEQTIEANDYEKPRRRFAKIAMKSTKRGLDIDFVGRKLADIAEAKYPKTRYALVPNHFSNWTLPRLLSDRTLDKAWKKILGV
jgi:short-subunit dehydrogenase